MTDNTMQGLMSSEPLENPSRLSLVVEPLSEGLRFEVTSQPVTRDGIEYQELSWKVTAESDTADVRFRLRLACPEWTTAPWFMIPAVMYGENRPDSETRYYPRFDPTAIQPKEFISSHWDFPADRTAIPGVFAFTGAHWTILVSEPHFQISGDVCLPEYEPQVGIGYRYDSEAQYLQISLPATDEPYALSGNAFVAPKRPTISLRAGATVSGVLYLFDFNADKHGYAPVVAHLANLWHEEHPTAVELDRNDLIAAAHEGILQWHYHEAESAFLYAIPYDQISEQIANAKGISLISDQMHVGWVSGLPVCYGLNWASRRKGDEEGILAAHRVADKFCNEGISPSGLFWGRYATPHPEALGAYFQGGKYSGWDGGWNPQPEMLHTRTLGEGVYFFAKLIQAEKSFGQNTDLWVNALRSNVEKMLAIQHEGNNGTFGTYYHAFTGEVLSWSGCGGLIWIPALLEAGKVFDRSYIEQAIWAGDYYAQNVRDEYVYGAPEDVGMTPTSEDGYNAIMAYAALYEVTQNPTYLDLCRIAADWTLTYRKLYNVRLHSKTLLGAYDFRSRGGDFASVRNNHLHMYGLICTAELIKLSQWTGNSYYEEMAREHWAYCSQNICLIDGQMNGYRGFASEQMYISDFMCLSNSLYLYEGIGEKPDWIPPKLAHNKGNFLPFTSLWCINHLILAAEALELMGK